MAEDSLRQEVLDPATNSDQLRADKDLLEELRETARNSNYKRFIVGYRNRNVQERRYQSGELVLRKLESTGAHVNKLQPPWEGPFVVKKEVFPGTYKLVGEDGRVVPQLELRASTQIL